MSAPLTCPRCHRTEGTPNNRGNPLRFNRKSGLCTGCYYTLIKNPNATPWRDPHAPKQTCARYARDAQERAHYLEANQVLERKRAQLAPTERKTP